MFYPPSTFFVCQSKYVYPEYCDNMGNDDITCIMWSPFYQQIVKRSPEVDIDT